MKLLNPTEFVEQHEGSTPIRQFRDLPTNHQMAVIWYMYCDGNAWVPPYDDAIGFQSDWKKQERDTKREIRTHLQKWINQYGDTEWGMAEIPTLALVDYVWRCLITHGTWNEEFDSWKEYHEWYYQDALRKSGKRHNMKDRWPCIWSLDLGYGVTDPIEDGWHRFHAYVRANHSTVPVIYAWNLLDSVRPL